MNRSLIGRNLILSVSMLVFFTEVGIADALQAADSHEVKADDLRYNFRSPAKQYRPMIRWWWPGGDVTDAELKREIASLADAGFGGAEIQPFSIGLDPNMKEEIRKRVDDYLTPSFFSHLRTVLDEARQRDFWIDYTFGSGYPSGGGMPITPELAAMELRFSQISVQGPRQLHQQLDVPKFRPGVGSAVKSQLLTRDDQLPVGWADRLKNREQLVAVIAARAQSADEITRPPGLPDVYDGPIKKSALLDGDSVTVLTGKISATGTLDWDVPPGQWQIFTFAQVPADLHVSGGVGAGPQLVLDHMKRASFDAHAGRVGDSARAELSEFLGNGMRAIFCDSIELWVYLPWTDNFLAEFHRRRGYDLTPFLPILKVPGNPERDIPIYDIEGIGKQIRHDYRQTVSDLMIENFFQPFVNWAAQNHLSTRLQAHGAQADVLRIYGLSDIPETETLGSGGKIEFLKLASSAAHIYGKEVTSSESFAWLGSPYQITPELIKRQADELIAAGVNEIVYHGFPYKHIGKTADGWYPFGEPFPIGSNVSPKNSFWKYIPTINSYITRLQYIARTAADASRVAIFRGRLSSDEDYTKAIIASGIASILNKSGYNFDYLNLDALLKSSAINRQLVSQGGSRYDMLIFQDETSITTELADEISRLSGEGVRIAFIGKTPTESITYLDNEDKSKYIRNLIGGVLSRSQAFHLKSVDEIPERFPKIIDRDVHFLGEPLPFIKREHNGLEIFFFRNADREPRQTAIELETTATPEIWDPWTGNITPVEYLNMPGNKLRVQLDFQAYESKLIIFNSDHKAGEAEPPKAQTKPIKTGAFEVGTQGWLFNGNGIDAQGEKHIQDLPLTRLGDWSTYPQLLNFSGKGIYTTQLDLAANWFEDKKSIVLNLGEVRDVAEIRINGKLSATLLMEPYKKDITAMVKPGKNLLEITVVSTLANALSARTLSSKISPPEANAIGQAILDFDNSYNNPSKIRTSSGLIGPVIVSNYKLPDR